MDSVIADEAVQRRGSVRSSALARLERMIEIRLVEERIRDLHREGKAWGTTHCADGQEAVAVGLAAAARPDDLVVCTHRTHHIGLALGVTPESLIAENVGRASGALGGLGGSMHLTATEVGLLHSIPIIGAMIPVAAGAALAAQVLGDERVAVAVFGDGGVNIGAFHESLNLAAVWRLPVVFLCENNVYAEYTASAETTPVPIATRADAYGMPSAVLDGQDVEAVREGLEQALARARAGDGPTLVEVATYRYGGHSASDQSSYRRDGELERWLERDPIAVQVAHLEALGEIGDLDALRRQVTARVDAATEAALAAPEPELAAMFANVLAPGPAPV